MGGKEVRYLRGNKELLGYASAVYELIEKEVKPGGLLPKSLDKITFEIDNGLCFLALNNRTVIGYVSIIPYESMGLTKISSHVVAVETRRLGIGTKLARMIYDLAKELYPQSRVITVVSLDNAGKFEKLGMVRIDKRDLPKEFLDTTSITLDDPNPNKVILIEP